MEKHIDIVIEFSPVYELAISLYAYLDKKNRKIFELGQEWYKQVNDQLSPQFKQKLKEDRIFLELGIDLMFIHSSAQKESIPEFLAWMHNLTEDKFRSIIRTILPEGVTEEDILMRLTKIDRFDVNDTDVFAIIRDHLFELFRRWYEEYFSKVQDDILPSLEQDAHEKREWARHIAPIDLVEKVTNGMYLEDIRVGKIYLIPQYHSNPFNVYPFNVYASGQNIQIYFYPTDIRSQKAGEPSVKLMRLVRCMADQTRLKILRFLNHKQKSFTDIVNEVGLAKSTVHHHMVVLRAAGLVKLYISEKRGVRYGLRESGIDEVAHLIYEYIKS